jgi:23S rRNA pseudouridine2457 synthase
MKYKTYALYKPYMVLSQFTREVEGQSTLADIIDVERNVYPVGRLDFDSEGLLILSNDPKLNALILTSKLYSKTYYVQVDGIIHDEALQKISTGVSFKLPNKTNYTSQPCTVNRIDPPLLPERNPPIRFRANLPTSWASITLNEGKKRQVRKMFAAVGFPVLRLVRYSIGQWTIEGMAPGTINEIIMN